MSRKREDETSLSHANMSDCPNSLSISTPQASPESETISSVPNNAPYAHNTVMSGMNAGMMSSHQVIPECNRLTPAPHCPMMSSSGTNGSATGPSMPSAPMYVMYSLKLPAMCATSQHNVSGKMKICT